MYMFPVILVDWAHRWRAASAAQSWSVILTPGRDDIHCSGCEELFKEHLKIILVRGENRWIWEDIPNTNGSWVETICVCVYTLGGEGELVFVALSGVEAGEGAKEGKPQWGKYGGITQAACPCIWSCITWWDRQLGGAPVTTSSGDHSGGLSHWLATCTDQWQILPPYAAQPPDGGCGWSGRGPRCSLRTPVESTKTSSKFLKW